MADREPGVALVLVDPEGHAARLDDQRYEARLSRDVKAARQDAMMIDDAFYRAGLRLRPVLAQLFPDLDGVGLVVTFGWVPHERDIAGCLSERYHPAVANWVAREHCSRYTRRPRAELDLRREDRGGYPFPFL